MGIFSSNRSIHKLMHERLAMEWRVLRNVYQNFLTEVQSGSGDEKLILEIVLKCNQINKTVENGFQTIGNPKPDKALIGSLMTNIIALDSQLTCKPEKAIRTVRLIGITNAILEGNYQGIFEDEDGNHADWYHGLK